MPMAAFVGLLIPLHGGPAADSAMDLQQLGVP